MPGFPFCEARQLFIANQWLLCGAAREARAGWRRYLGKALPILRDFCENWRDSGCMVCVSIFRLRGFFL